MTSITALNINGTDRKADHMGSIRIQRILNAVGSMEFWLDNEAGTYDDLLSAEHNYVQLDLDSAQFFYGHVHKVDTVGQDQDGRWEKLCWVQALDEGEELLFFDDFEKTYNDPDQTIDDVLDDIFNHAGLTWYHVNYIGGSAGDAALGAFEKKEGKSLLSFLQEIHQSVDQIFYVNDSGQFTSKPLNNLSSSGVTLSRSNLIEQLRFHRQDAGKLYNYIKLYGKNPMFDAYTEFTASSLTPDEATITDEITDVKVGKASVKVTKSGSPSNFGVYFDFTPTDGLFSYTALNLTKGSVGCWIYQHGGSDQQKYRVQLKDSNGNEINYKGKLTEIYKDHWGWIEAPLGKDLVNVTYDDQWWPAPLDGQFLWETVKKIWIGPEMPVAVPDYFIMDGLSMPLPPIAVASKGGFSTVVHRRPFVGSRADIRTQVALQRAADTFLSQHKDAALDSIVGLFGGDRSLRYAGQGFVANFDMDMSSLDFYASQLLHIIAPRGDAGKGWDHTMQVEGVYINERAWDLGRLGPQPVAGYSIPGIGLKEK